MAFAGDLLLTLSIHKICERSEAAIDPKSLISLFATAQTTKSAHDTSALGFVPISCARVALGVGCHCENRDGRFVAMT